MALTSNAAMLWRNLADDATITASSQLSAALVARLQNEHVAVKWRSAAEPAWVLIDHGAAVPIDTVAIFGLTATDARCRISNNADATLETLFDSTEQPTDADYRQAVWLLPASVTARYVRIDLVHDDLAYVEAGRVVTGLRSTFGSSPAMGASIAHVDPSDVKETLGGQEIVYPKPVYRELTAPMDMLTAAEARGFVAACAREAGTKSDVLFIANEASPNLAYDAIWGRNADPSPAVQASRDNFTKTYLIRERR